MNSLVIKFGLLSLVLGVLFLTSQIAIAGQSVLDRIQHVDESFDSSTIEAVHPLTVKTVRAEETYQGGAFKVLARKGSIHRYPCSTCHTDKVVKVTNAALFSHADVKINHGKGENALTCFGCHHLKNRDVLKDSKGSKIDFDHSYQLCGQCHFRQKRDWLGGAHGKRETYWAGERVVWNCTSCHDPHAPAFGTKMPETYSLPLDN